MGSRIIARVEATAREGYKPTDLKVADLQEVNFWVSTFENLIEMVCFDYPHSEMPEEVAKILASVAEDFCTNLEEYLEAEVREILLSIIDNYEEE